MSNMVNLKHEKIESFNIGWESTNEVELDAKSVAMEMGFYLEEHLSKKTEPNNVYVVTITINKVIKDAAD